MSSKESIMLLAKSQGCFFTLPPMCFIVTLFTEGHAIPKFMSVLWVLRKREYVVGMQFATSMSALLTSPVIAGVNGIAPLFIFGQTPDPLIFRGNPATPMPMVFTLRMLSMSFQFE